MEIKILQLIEGAKKAVGLTVIIDVFRAFSTACYVFDKGAEKIIPVGKLETAYSLKEKNPNYLLMGERKGKMLSGFDYGNSPYLIQEKEFTGRTVIHTTSAGTQGIVNAINAQEIITGSFVNAEAVADYIIKKSPVKVSLVCMGYAGIEPADEDIFCAHYIKSLVQRKTGSSEAGAFFYTDEEKEMKKKKIIEKLREGSGRRFFDPDNQEWSPSADFDFCLQFDIFDFILRAESYDSRLFFLKKLEISSMG